MTKQERIRANQLGLKVGDWLTFHDGRVRVKVDEIQEYILKAIPETAELQDLSKPYSESLRNLTFRLTEEAHSLNECLDLWHINTETLRQHYMAQQEQGPDPRRP
jgi:ASC-1-like (ASCH) protein